MKIEKKIRKKRGKGEKSGVTVVGKESKEKNSKEGELWWGGDIKR